jgi:hypothetical protein
VQAVSSSIGTGPSPSQIASERDTVHIIPQSSATFHITPSILCMDDIVGQTPLKDLAQLQLVLLRIPSKALHKLEVSVTLEVKYLARIDIAKL